jgi:hypothetical protein
MVRVEKSTDPIIHRHASYNSARRLLITVVETGSPSAWNSEPTRSPLARERKMRRIVVEWEQAWPTCPAVDRTFQAALVLPLIVPRYPPRSRT